MSSARWWPFCRGVDEWIHTMDLCISQIKHLYKQQNAQATRTSERSSHCWVCVWLWLHWTHFPNNVTFGTHIWWPFCDVFICFFFKRSISMYERDPTTTLSWHLFPVLPSKIELNYSKQMFPLMWMANENLLVWTIVWTLLQHWNHVSKWASLACGLPIKYSGSAHVHCEVAGLKNCD